jgi:hypothetical protein
VLLRVILAPLRYNLGTGGKGATISNAFFLSSKSKVCKKSGSGDELVEIDIVADGARAALARRVVFRIST